MNLQKKFSIGISFSKISTSEWELFLQRNAYYIHDIYFSPFEYPFLQTRQTIYDYNNDSLDRIENNLSIVLFFAKKIGIKLKMVLNSPMLYRLSTREVESIYLRYKGRYNIDYVTTFTDVAKLIRDINSNEHFVCSYNEGILNRQQLDSIINYHIFDSIVIGPKFFRNITLLTHMVNSGCTPEILLNNGCLPECDSYCSKGGNYCRIQFEKAVQNHTPEQIYAESSIFPEELQKYDILRLNTMLFKLSSRPISYVELNKMFESYISFDSKSYISKDSSYYHLYGRLGHFIRHYDSFDYYNILRAKDNFWG